MFKNKEIIDLVNLANVLKQVYHNLASLTEMNNLPHSSSCHINRIKVLIYWYGLYIHHLTWLYHSPSLVFNWLFSIRLTSKLLFSPFAYTSLWKKTPQYHICSYDVCCPTLFWCISILQGQVVWYPLWSPFFAISLPGFEIHALEKPRLHYIKKYLHYE